jgi:thiol-disulfide isomerase/thioredoxin
MGFFLLISLTLQGQTLPLAGGIRPLSIGDTMPDVPLENIHNYGKSNARFSDFKGKWVIIDFWFGACPGCIESFPQMEELQRKFGDKIQVLMVNFETQKKIEETFKKYEKKSPSYRNPKLPSIVSDTIFHKLFPHQYYPHEVWIDPSGVVKAFTSAMEVTQANLQAMLEGKTVKMDMKIDNLTFNDAKYSLLSQVYAEYPTHLRYYSAILNFVPGLSGGLFRQIIDSSSKTVRITRRNMTILKLFSYAMPNGAGVDPFASPAFDFGKRVILQVKDSGRYFYNPGHGETKGEWEQKNCYTYEAVMPLEQKDNMQQLMLFDLQRFFNSTCHVEKRKMNCLALVRTSSVDRIRSKEGKALSIFDKELDTSKVQLRAGLTVWLVEAIARANKSTPYLFADATNYTSRVDIELDKKLLGDLPRLRKELRAKYDLDLISKELKVDVLVFKENDYAQ